MVWSLSYQPFVTNLRGQNNLWSSLPWLLSFAPQLATLLFYLWLIRIARWQLSHELTGAQPLDPRQILSRALPRMAVAIQRARQWRAV
jgi:hypothetical protein